jgi:hypothetical protein
MENRKEANELRESKEQKDGVREYKEERFSFILYLNDNQVCKRYFKINNYIEDSMHSVDFKFVFDELVALIDDDLKSKSRVYTWYYYDENHVDEEFVNELPKPWEYTLKFVVYDNKKPVMERIWDASGYPKAVLDRIDLTNKWFRVSSREGRTYTFEKNEYLENNGNRLSAEVYVQKAMIMDKKDVPFEIIRRICDACSPRDNGYQVQGDYTFEDEFKQKGKKTKPYITSLRMANQGVVQGWSKKLYEKTKKHVVELHYKVGNVNKQ